MAIVYHGRVESLAREIADVRDILDKRYEELLGIDNARKLRETSSRVLSPKSFFDSVEEWNKYVGRNDLPADTSNKMMLLAPHNIDIKENGIIGQRKLSTSIAFYISEHGFRHSGSFEDTDRLIASYVHEYDHYVWYALQKTPIYAGEMFLESYLGINLGEVNIPSYLQNLPDDLPANEALDRVCLSIFLMHIVESHEKATRILDKLVLESIGINMIVRDRMQPRTYSSVDMPRLRKRVVFGTGGDIFYGLSDNEVVERFLNWENCINPHMRTPFVLNLVESLKGLKVSRLYIEDFGGVVERREKKNGRK